MLDVMYFTFNVRAAVNICDYPLAGGRYRGGVAVADFLAYLR